MACIRSVLGAKDPAAAAIALWKAIALAVLMAALPARADDSRYQDFPVGSRATTLGGAFAALSDDPSGLYYNPAGICDARKLNVNVSASLYGFERQSRGTITIDRGTFSIAALNELNVIPGEAGLLKGVGALDDRGTPFAYGFDVTVPQFRSYGVDATSPFDVHNRVSDRTFNIAAGGAMRFTDKLNIGFALHYVLRLYETSEDAALAAKKPFVLIFATPKFCQTATCGPTLDRLKPVAAAHPELTFINVEPYQLEFTNGALQPVLTGQDLTPVEARYVSR